MVLCVAPLLLGTVAATVLATTSLTGKASSNAAGTLGCLAGLGLLLALVGAMCISDFRKWYATRSVRLVVFQKGFTYQNKSQMEFSHWSDIKHIDFKLIEVKSKHSPARRVTAVRSIVRNYGTVIGFADTLKLEKITRLIKIASGKAG